MRWPAGASATRAARTASATIRPRCAAASIRPGRGSCPAGDAHASVPAPRTPVPTMTPSDLRSRLSGVVGFPVTPFTDALALDLPGLRANGAAMTAHPFCVIVAAGGTGELYSLNTEEHTAVVKTSVEATGGRMPVIAGVGGNI